MYIRCTVTVSYTKQKHIGHKKFQGKEEPATKSSEINQGQEVWQLFYCCNYDIHTLLAFYFCRLEYFFWRMSTLFVDT